MWAVPEVGVERVVPPVVGPGLLEGKGEARVRNDGVHHLEILVRLGVPAVHIPPCPLVVTLAVLVHHDAPDPLRHEAQLLFVIEGNTARSGAMDRGIPKQGFLEVIHFTEPDLYPVDFREKREHLIEGCLHDLEHLRFHRAQDAGHANMGQLIHVKNDGGEGHQEHIAGQKQLKVP